MDARLAEHHTVSLQWCKEQLAAKSIIVDWHNGWMQIKNNTIQFPVYRNGIWLSRYHRKTMTSTLCPALNVICIKSGTIAYWYYRNEDQ